MEQKKDGLLPKAALASIAVVALTGATFFGMSLGHQEARDIINSNSSSAEGYAMAVNEIQGLSEAQIKQVAEAVANMHVDLAALVKEHVKPSTGDSGIECSDAYLNLFNKRVDEYREQIAAIKAGKTLDSKVNTVTSTSNYNRQPYEMGI